MSRNIQRIIEEVKDDNEVCYLMLSEIKKEIRYCRNAKRLEALTEKSSILMSGVLINTMIIGSSYKHLDRLKKRTTMSRFFRKV